MFQFEIERSLFHAVMAFIKGKEIMARGIYIPILSFVILVSGAIIILDHNFCEVNLVSKSNN